MIKKNNVNKNQNNIKLINITQKCKFAAVQYFMILFFKFIKNTGIRHQRYRKLLLDVTFY